MTAQSKKPEYSNPLWLMVMLVASVAMSGCAGEDMQDLQAYVAQVKASHKGRLAPMPEPKPFESMEYAAHTLRDPFVPTFVDPTKQPLELRGMNARGQQPRRREPLESFPLDTLKLMGTLQRGGSIQAVIKAPDGAMYTVKSGAYVGQNHGQITRVTENRLELRELISDGMGGWERRSTTMGLSE